MTPLAITFGEVAFNQAAFAQEADIGTTEIGIGVALAAAGLWFVRRGSKRILKAWRKYRGAA